MWRQRGWKTWVRGQGVNFFGRSLLNGRVGGGCNLAWFANSTKWFSCSLCARHRLLKRSNYEQSREGCRKQHTHMINRSLTANNTATVGWQVTRRPILLAYPSLSDKQVELYTQWPRWNLGRSTTEFKAFSWRRSRGGGLPSADGTTHHFGTTNWAYAMDQACRKRIHQWADGHHGLSKWNRAREPPWPFIDGKVVCWSGPSNGSQQFFSSGRPLFYCIERSTYKCQKLFEYASRHGPQARYGNWLH